MEDSSGVAIFNSFTGLSAFLRSDTTNFCKVVSLVENREGFQPKELMAVLGVNSSKFERLINWLVDNRFIRQSQ
jgi:hypothetical protein